MSSEEEPPFRAFVPAKRDLAELGELADLEKVSVLTYNVLSQMGARRMQRGGKSYVRAGILNIRQRRDRLLREILSYDADIMCLQEVDEYDDWWAVELATAGYDSIYATSAAPNSAAVVKEIDEGLVTAFRKSTFQLFRSTEVHLNDLCTNINDPNLAARAKQDKLALLVSLQPWETSALPSALCVVNTQLAAGATPEMERVRVLQTEYLCRQIAVFNADFQLPIVLAGTFNATPSSDVYHTILTGRRRPVTEAPAAPNRPVVDDPTASSLRINWQPPQPSTTSLTSSAPILEYKVSVKNCASKTSGFLYELAVPDGAAKSFVVTSLSANMTYQFRVMARNEHGWGHWSQPSAPESTLEHAAYKRRAPSTADSDEKPLFLAPDVPPDVKVYDISFGSGRTPRYTSDAKQTKPIVNADVCPRPLLSALDRSVGGSDQRAEEKRYTTLHPRADRDSLLVHSETMESAYGAYAEYMSEPELTFSGKNFQGTIDYIFHSTGQLTPFQLLQLPTLEELEAVGQDDREPLSVADVEWVKHKPEDWHDSVAEDAKETDRYASTRYMGTWCAPILPNVFGRASSWLPNAHCPSDHLPLACVFAVRKQNLAVMWN
ncbi:Carbon catabolite repressor protein 4 2 [Phytophthora cinnamomi]|uniref:Carbon catabolite repressor protein 4 2 n=1 Tax=Phytophthora cinnamomi TaxID=4785 RepID=UPI003559AAF3|nr:Carbon catabolite repressor protein 4 2 [Phytophthora cinnamomi]